MMPLATPSLSLFTLSGLARNGCAGYPVFTLPFRMEAEIEELRLWLRNTIQKHNLPADEPMDEILLPGPGGDEVAFLIDESLMLNLKRESRGLSDSLCDQVNGWNDSPKRSMLPEGVELPAHCIQRLGFSLAHHPARLTPDVVGTAEYFDHRTGTLGYMFHLILPSPEADAARKLDLLDDRRLMPATLIHAVTAAAAGEAAVIEICRWQQRSATRSTLSESAYARSPLLDRTIFRAPKEFIPKELRQPPHWMKNPPAD